MLWRQQINKKVLVVIEKTKKHINIVDSILEVIQVDFGEENWVSGTAAEGKSSEFEPSGCIVYF